MMKPAADTSPGMTGVSACEGNGRDATASPPAKRLDPPAAGLATNGHHSEILPGG
jgi:hypothetical protein